MFHFLYFVYYFAYNTFLEILHLQNMICWTNFTCWNWNILMTSLELHHFTSTFFELLYLNYVKYFTWIILLEIMDLNCYNLKVHETRLKSKMFSLDNEMLSSMKGPLPPKVTFHERVSSIKGRLSSMVIFQTLDFEAGTKLNNTSITWK